MVNITEYMDQYGYFVLLVALLLEMIAVPLPGEVLMSYTGFLVYQQHLNWIISILVAGMGTSIGMTLAYWIGGKLGTPFFEKYGHRFHMGPERIEKTSEWFSKHGNKLLIIAYFIPGVRHITGYFSGLTGLPFRIFSLFAYIGAFLWVTVFISLGKILGPQWELFHTSARKYLIIGSIIAAVLLVTYYVFQKRKQKIKESAINVVTSTLNVFHTRKKAGLLLVSTAAVTLGFIILMIGMIQDFAGNEFRDFNKLIGFLIPVLFGDQWSEAMALFLFIGSRKVLFTIIIFTALWILWKGRDKVLELSSMVLAVGGGELYEESLRRIFHEFSPIKHSLTDAFLYSFPSERSLMTFVIYGFFIYILVRRSGQALIHTLAPVIGVILLLFIAISRLFFKLELPSDIAAGYVFGGVWLGVNILVLEVLRLLRNIDVK